MNERKKFDTNNFEQEKKLTPKNPENFAHLRPLGTPIEQVYLSAPDEEYSLRIRKTHTHTATLKNTGEVTAEGIKRLEIETEIPIDIYDYYRQIGHRILQKIRYEPCEGVCFDFYNSGEIQVEYENPTNWQIFTADTGLSDSDFIDVSHLPSALNINKATPINELPAQTPDTPISEILDLIQSKTDTEPTVITITGRSGSGKSTYVRELQQNLQALGHTPTIISSDDYNRGVTALRNPTTGEKWQSWDHPDTYDLRALDTDIYKLKNGIAVPRRVYDFVSGDPVIDGVVEPASVVIVEGLYTRQLNSDKCIEIATPFATCLGRRILRDIVERPGMANPEKNLLYVMEQAEPAWRNQQAATR